MKKILSAILASAMALSLSAVAFADTTTQNNIITKAITVPGGSGNIVIGGSGTNVNTHTNLIVGPGTKGEYDVSGHGFPLYTWGTTDTVEYNVVPAVLEAAPDQFDVDYKITGITAHVNSGNVNVSVKKNGGTLYGGAAAPSIKLKANTAGRDFKFDEEYNDVSVDVDLTIAPIKADGTLGDKSDSTITLKADKSTAYSKTQELLNDEDITVSKTNGSIVKFGEAIVDKTRVRANEYVDVFFKGNYGTDKENMRVFTDPITEVTTYFDETDTSVYDFAFTPKFASSVKVAIDADENAFVYEYNKKTGDITKIETGYESNAHTFETKNLGCYIVSEDEYEDGNVIGDTDETPESTPDTDSSESTETDKVNPSTGASDMAGAAMMALVSMGGIAALVAKKASK